ncbi:hypothetical protein D9756_000477 [Leucocoprinus leucothites]|uniref:Uncharacterized protein n=1 Tax=Leucocoprinus leucothites TaxID=201217 RepID=A0A8H5GFD5_9AGAR|nr:hypothetical protein D9756_000477 [Leucoagaricus leucothites]
MGFKARNLYYLRIAEQTVLPVYLYLDERHLDWMSDQVLQHVLSDLRPRILNKLQAEDGLLTSPAAAKKATVDTHRGETYQFCYFLRRTEPHSVAIKTRNYVARSHIPVQSSTQTPAATSTATTNPRRTQRKRKTRSGSTPLSPPPSRSVKKQRKDATLELDDSDVTETDGSATKKKERVVEIVDIDQDEDMIDLNAEEDTDEDDESWRPRKDTFGLPADEEEEKPKPALQLKYKGFCIYGLCLCIVVEPWPIIRSSTRPPQELGGIASKKSTDKQTSVPPASTTIARSKTPLFLADEDVDPDETQSQKPDPVTNPWDDLETMESSDDDSEVGGMMAFSQALNLAGDSRPGAVEDDDEMEGTVLFGDADEVRQL